jgi:hypothetical protein
MMTPDEICNKYSKQSVGLVIDQIFDEDGKLQFLSIEGSKEALELVGDLALSVANGPEGENFLISPVGAGSFHFSKKSKLGIGFVKKGRI